MGQAWVERVEKCARSWKDIATLSVGDAEHDMEKGWKEVDPKERWWDQAMGGVLEDRRREGMKVVNVVRGGVGNL